MLIENPLYNFSRNGSLTSPLEVITYIELDEPKRNSGGVLISLEAVFVTFILEVVENVKRPPTWRGDWIVKSWRDKDWLEKVEDRAKNYINQILCGIFALEGFWGRLWG